MLKGGTNHKVFLDLFFSLLFSPIWVRLFIVSIAYKAGSLLTVIQNFCSGKFYEKLEY